MAGLFSLGGGGGGGGRGGSNNQDDQPHNPPTAVPHPDTFLWYKNNEDVSSYRGFELWNQQQQQEQHLIPQARPLFHQDLYSPAVALGVGPSRSSDDQSSTRSGFMVMRSGGGGGSGGISCQDCGNQAKKDCPHMRCRTCCKSRGYDCQTHVKSTWVPAAKRRERQQQQQQQLRGDQSKRQRDGNNDNSNPSSSAAAAALATTSTHLQMPTTHSSSEGLDHGSFPPLVSSSVEFRCVRVSSMDEADEQYAYQTAVNIGGHVFRGILYDHGPDSSYMSTGDTSSTGAGGGVQPLNLIAAAPALPTTAALGSSTASLVDPSLYAAPLNTFMSGSGTQFFPHPRS
ncbi:protein SHI RELATED SEQUENCE 1-like isoform X1 [Senna tora]|uniref:Protein SHI RELATED SEQUENCE 1-like isoform X1 n=1 Tax=Senna tora TaxID=362788 RepID=A0A834WR89_9FABA|nr:protein SHI RELATED SEQUENCE 1-like isoform X1 [Senna tora]